MHISSSTQFKSGAFSALPSLNSKPMLSVCFSIRSFGTCLVPISAGLSAPGTFPYLTDLEELASCSHKYDVSICLSVPSPFLSIIPNAAEASENIFPEHTLSHSLSPVITPNASAVALTSAYISASAELKAITDWFFDHALIKWDPILITPPDVLVRVILFPAQSLSEYTDIESGHSCQ